MASFPLRPPHCRQPTGVRPWAWVDNPAKTLVVPREPRDLGPLVTTLLAHPLCVSLSLLPAYSPILQVVLYLALPSLPPGSAPLPGMNEVTIGKMPTRKLELGGGAALSDL